MSEKNRLQEVNTLFNNPNILNEELHNAMENLKNCFQKNYIQKVYMAANKEEENAKENPSKEIVLLRALKGFTQSPQGAKIENTIELLNLLQAAQSIQHGFGEIKNQQKTISISSNDTGCAPISTNNLEAQKLLTLLALMKKL